MVSEIGIGTTATLIAPERAPVPGQELLADLDPARLTGDVRRASAWMWAILVCSAELIASLLARAGDLATLSMVGLVGGCAGLAWWTCRGGRMLPRWASALLAGAVVPAFLLDLAGTGYGEIPYLWQPISLTPLLVILLVLARSLVPLGFALAAIITSAGAIAVSGPSDATVVVTAGTVVQLIQFGAWVAFARALDIVGRRTASDRTRSAAEHLALVAAEAAAVSRERWNVAGIRRALALLRAVAADPMLVGDPETRRACGVEEAHLRQLTLIDPELVQLGAWFAQALNLARDRRVSLTLRVLGGDVSTARSAAAWGGTMLDAVVATRRGGSLTVTWLWEGEAPQMLFVGPHGLGDSLVPAQPTDSGRSFLAHHYESQDFIEAAVPSEPGHIPGARIRSQA